MRLTPKTARESTCGFSIGICRGKSGASILAGAQAHLHGDAARGEHLRSSHSQALQKGKEGYIDPRKKDKTIDGFGEELGRF